MVKSSGGNSGNDKTKSDEQDDDDYIPVITLGEGYYLKSSLILFIIFFLF
jgi:hypothetical protein